MSLLIAAVSYVLLLCIAIVYCGAWLCLCMHECTERQSRAASSFGLTFESSSCIAGLDFGAGRVKLRWLRSRKFISESIKPLPVACNCLCLVPDLLLADLLLGCRLRLLCVCKNVFAY